MEDIITNDQGGSQSDIKVRFDLIPAESLEVVASILSAGAIKYGANNWHKIPTADHINHAIAHLYKFLRGDKTENHLGNAACRVLFAVWTNQQVDPLYPTET